MSHFGECGSLLPLCPLREGTAADLAVGVDHVVS
jgi:hypothetical protein